MSLQIERLPLKKESFRFSSNLEIETQETHNDFVTAAFLQTRTSRSFFVFEKVIVNIAQFSYSHFPLHKRNFTE
jgi:hypothetical protein